MARYHALHGKPARPEQTVVIGDTPHDIDCAKLNGCQSLGVATGQFSVEELKARGATHALSDLAQTQAVLAWLLTAVGASGAATS
jgi:phosphoglycolate phosphatase-like HAD superfamily hydrolase